MPSAFAHAAVGAALATRLPPSRQRLWVGLVLALAAAAPDLDVIGFRLGVPYEDVWGHRGWTHSLAFAAIVGLGSWPLWRSAGARQAGIAAVLLFFAIASHGLLDAFTDAGHGVGLWIPFDDARVFAPFRPIATSPLSLRAFFSGRGLEILASEAVWIGPLVAAIVWAPRRRTRGRKAASSSPGVR